MKPQSIIAPLLAWYDRHGRDLPWRHKGAKHPDPYAVWLSEIMLQQTTVPAVMPYFLKFMEKYPDIRALAEAPDADVMQAWAGLGYYARARNMLACARAVVREHGGEFPRDISGLTALPGIGAYTAGAIAAIAFGQRAPVIDGNIERVAARLFAIEAPLPQGKKAIQAAARPLFESRANTRPHDLPQALMDLAATICTPRAPKCGACPIRTACAAHKARLAGELPRRTAKQSRPKRRGFAYWIVDDAGRVLMETRPAKGLLGGMRGLPTSVWDEDPAHPAWLRIGKNAKPRHVRHVFTHFELDLAVLPATISTVPAGYFFTAPEADGLPSVFAKAVKMMKGQ
ncbi:MAG: A/G-specific adenine glycosylase [Alphaproteobacteria bacterium]|nr:A/G-specific adenine glycosylase [Alphaproteobacteria bacterium]USO07646.1 MAG: A/G-specific adenine glycosylase [Rhodospirillales bacterium]